mgnify:CR=1 FL=1
MHSFPKHLALHQSNIYLVEEHAPDVVLESWTTNLSRLISWFAYMCKFEYHEWNYVTMCFFFQKEATFPLVSVILHGMFGAWGKAREKNIKNTLC